MSRGVWVVVALLVGCSGGSGDGSGAALDDATADTVTTDVGSADDSSVEQPVDSANDTGATAVGDAAPSSATSLVVEPDDGDTEIFSAISGAKKSVHLEMYLLSDAAALKALTSAKKAGREVKVVLEKSPYPSPTANQAAYDQLKAAGVDVTWTTGLYALTHTKTFIIDGATAWVMTLNFTAAGLTSNREYALRIVDPTDVAEAEAIFAADFAGTAAPPLTGALVVSPVSSRTRIGALIDAARSTLDVEMEEMSDDGIAQRIDDALARGVKVRAVVPTVRPVAMDTKIALIKSHGAQVRALGTPDVHAKCIVADGAKAFVGSENLTYASLDKNREIGAITTTTPVITRLSATIAADFAKGTPL